MAILKGLRRLSFYRNRSTESQLSIPGSESLSSSPVSSNDSSPPQSLLALPESVQSNTSGSLSFAPIIDNIRQDQVVIYQVVLLQGHVPAGPRPDGTLTLRDSKGQCPPTTWPVSQSKFKALVYLHPGINMINLEYMATGSRSVYRSAYKFVYQPMVSAPPVKLVMFHAKDSEYASANDEEPAALSLAKAQYRMAAYLWQSFMAESMNKLGHSRRTFQLENSWDQSTLFAQDIRSGVARNQAPVHVIELDKTIKDLDTMGQSDMISYIETVLMKNFKQYSKTKQYFSCMLLDAEWDPETETAKRSATFGGKGSIYEQINFSLFGGHLLASYPAAIDEVTSSLVDVSSAQNSLEALKSKSASAGMGEQLRQIGFMLNLPQQEAGIMSDDCKRFGNMFAANLALQAKDITLHPLDAIRLRYHPAFHAPWGPPPSTKTDSGVSFWGTSNTSMQISSRVGISAVEIYKLEDTLCHYWMDFLSKSGPPRNKVNLSFNDLVNATLSPASSRRSSIRRSVHHGPLNLKILTADGKEHVINNVEAFAKNLKGSVPELKTPVFSNMMVGQPEGETTETSVFFPQSSRMLSLTVFHDPGSSVSGIEFTYELGAKYLLGSRSTESHKEWPLNVAGGETLMGMEVNVSKATNALCGLRACSNTGRFSPWFGAAEGDLTS
jgi:hypothetical protein